MKMGISSVSVAIVFSRFVLSFALADEYRRYFFMTPQSFPDLYSPDCSTVYHRSAVRYYLCDPHNVLGRTTTGKLSNIMADWWTYCGLSSLNQGKYLTLGIAVSKFMLLNTNASCVSSEFSGPSEKQKLRSLVQDSAKLIQEKWRSKNCSTDFFILILGSTEYCINNSWRTRHHLSSGIALSDSLLKLIPEKSRHHLSRLTAEKLTEFGILKLVSRILKQYQYLVTRNRFPESTTKLPNTDVPSARKRNYLIHHSVPLWALILFVVALIVAFSCAYLGHWFNITHESRSHGAHGGFMAKNSHRHKKWGAGFMGGVMEMKGSGGDQVASRPARAKLFGGLGARRTQGATSTKNPSRF